MQHVILLLSVMIGIHKKTDKLGSRPDYVISESHTKECSGFIGEEFKLSGRFNDTVFVNMPGEFVPLNGAATIATIEALGIPADAARKALSHIHIKRQSGHDLSHRRPKCMH